MFSRYAKTPAPDPGSPPGSPSERDIPISQQAAEIQAELEGLMGDTVMKIGKHRGRTFSFIAKDKYYVKWVRDQKYPKGALGMLKTWLDKNADWLLEQNMKTAIEAKGTLAKRVRNWDVEEMRTRGILRSVPDLQNATFGKSKRPRPPPYSLQEAGVLAAWQPGLSKGDRWRMRADGALVDRFLGYIFRRMLHESRDEPVSEKLIADKALKVLELNDFAYHFALKHAHPKGDPDGSVNLGDLETALQEERSGPGSSLHPPLPETLKPCFSRLGCSGQGPSRDGAEDTGTSTPRRILLRFMLSIPQLKQALSTFRNIRQFSWVSREVIEACWCMARGDGAFDHDRISNTAIPEKLFDIGLGVYRFMHRFIDANLRIVDKRDLHYGACVGFQETGCPVEADFRVGDSVLCIRGSLWLSPHFDNSYLQGYVALARQNGLVVNRTVVLYVQHGVKIECDLADWDHRRLLDFLKSDPDAQGALRGCDLGMCDPSAPSMEPEEPTEIEEKKKQRALKEKRNLGRLALAR